MSTFCCAFAYATELSLATFRATGERVLRTNQSRSPIRHPRKKEALDE